MALVIELSVIGPVQSQECAGTPREWLDLIESRLSANDSVRLTEPVNCLSHPAEFYVSHYDDFIKDGVMKRIEAETRNERLRVFKLLMPLARSGNRDLSLEAMAALAYYRYHPSADMMGIYPDGPKKAVLLAIVGQRRSFIWAMNQYEILDRAGDVGAGDKTIAKMAYLNLLYYLAEPGSLEFVKDIIRRPESDSIIARAQLIIERIYQLNPETK